MAPRAMPAAILADIGGSNARFARLTDDARPGRATIFATADHPTFDRALRAYLRAEGLDPPIDAIAVCAAGPVEDDGAISLTNCPWRIAPDEITRATGAADPIVVNDFAAVAHALPALADDDRRSLGGGPARPGSPLGVVGPGTGLGMAGIVPDARGRPVVVEGEGGHASLAPATDREWRVIEQLTATHGHASRESVVSGPGLANLYAAIARVDGDDAAAPNPAAIAIAAWAGTDPRASEAIALFTGWLGAIAGDLALTLGARGGVYVAGGIVPAWGERFDAAHFRARFEAKGRFRGWLEAVPAWCITRPQPGLLGLARLAAEALAPAYSAGVGGR